MATLFSGTVQEAVFRAIGISTLSEVFDKEFLDINPNQDISRETLNKVYSDRNRGSIRLNSGKYYTASEFKARVDRVKSLHLP